jgi:hypothetical protein
MKNFSRRAARLPKKDLHHWSKIFHGYTKGKIPLFLPALYQKRMPFKPYSISIKIIVCITKINCPAPAEIPHQASPITGNSSEVKLSTITIRLCCQKKQKL